MRVEPPRSEEERPSHRTELHLFIRKVAIVALFVVGIIALWAIRRVLVLLFIAGVLAAGIAPAVRRVRAVVHHYTGRKIRRGTAVLIVYLPFVLGTVTLLVLAVPRLLDESQQLSTELPRLIDQKVLAPLGQYVPVGEIRRWVFRDWKADFEVFGYIRGAVTLVASVVAVLFLIAYMLIDAERLRNTFLLFYPPEERSSKRRMVHRASRRMSNWLGGQLTLAGIIGLATFVALLLLGVPYAVPLAFIAAVGEMVPVIGPIVGAIPAVIIALFQSTWQFWAVLIMAVVIQQVENYFLVPRLMARKVSVSPLAVFVAFMIGATLLGIIGAIMAIPAVAIVQVAFEEVFIARRERRLDSTRPGTLTRTERE